MRRINQTLLGALAVLGIHTGVQAEALYAITAGNSLVRFNSSTPGLTSTTLVTGLAAGEQLLGIDFRPLTGELYGLGSSNRLYTLDLTSGAASLAGTGPANDPFTTPLAGSSFGFDFNPTVDRIRITGASGQNLRANPITGAIAATDTALAGGVSVVGSAYDRNDLDPGTPTTLFVIDSVSDSLFRQGGVDGSPSPNGGALTLIGSLGFDTGTFVGFDISSASGFAYATLTAPGSFSSGLYRINLGTGAATLLGNTGLLLNGVAVAPVPLPGAVWLAASGLLGLLASRRQRRDNMVV